MKDRQNFDIPSKVRSPDNRGVGLGKNLKSLKGALALFFCTTLYAETNVTPIRSIQLVGLSKTHPQVVKRELLLKEGDVSDPELWKQSIERLHNLQIFSKIRFVSAESFYEGRLLADITLEFEERWTTIPFFSVRSGGGVTSYQAGIFDVNTFGRGLEVGGLYENLTGTHSGAVWFRNPRTFDQRLKTGFDLQILTRNRDLYNEEGTRQGAYTLRAYRIYVPIEKEITPNLMFGVSLDNRWDRTSEDKITTGSQNLNLQNGFSVAHAKRRRLVGISSRLGRLNTEVFLVEGQIFETQFRQGIRVMGAEDKDHYLLTRFKKFWRWNRLNFGVHTSFFHTTSHDLQMQSYLGGFDAIRGYVDGILRARNTLQGNVEFRVPSFEKPWWVLQHVFFADAGRGGDHFFTPFSGDEKTFVSVGTGMRLISPKIYSFNGRLDIAYTLTEPGGWGVAFGTQQFF